MQSCFLLLKDLQRKISFIRKQKATSSFHYPLLLFHLILQQETNISFCHDFLFPILQKKKRNELSIRWTKPISTVRFIQRKTKIHISFWEIGLQTRLLSTWKKSILHLVPFAAVSIKLLWQPFSENWQKINARQCLSSNTDPAEMIKQALSRTFICCLLRRSLNKHKDVFGSRDAPR